MNNEKINAQKTPLGWLGVVIIILLVLGVIFRFVNLDKKIYWFDEACTSLRISGYTEADFLQEFSYNRVISPTDLRPYQSPNLEKNLVDTVEGLATEEPQLTPAYFIIVRLWAQWFGSSILAIRSLSVFISLFVFPALYWLCLELFQSKRVGWVAVALTAVSPFHLLFAQEARPYSLWTVLILVSSAALLRAMRLNTKTSWLIYSASITLGLYSYLLCGLIFIGHGIYIALLDRFRFSKNLISYVISSIIGLIPFLAWIFVLIDNFSKSPQSSLLKSASSKSKGSLIDLVSQTVENIKAFVGTLNLAVYDLNFKFLGSNADKSLKFFDITLRFVVMLILGFAIFLVFKKCQNRVWLFILTLSGVTGSVIVFGLNQSPPRYLVPVYLSVQLTIAYLIANQISFLGTIGNQKKSSLILPAFIVLIEIFSCLVSLQSPMWWNKGDYNVSQEAQFINKSITPLVISDGTTCSLLSLSHYLQPNVKLLINPSSQFTGKRQCTNCNEPDIQSGKINLPTIPDGFSEVFLFLPSKFLRREITKTHQLQSVKIAGEPPVDVLWRIVK